MNASVNNNDKENYYYSQKPYKIAISLIILVLILIINVEVELSQEAKFIMDIILFLILVYASINMFEYVARINIWTSTQGLFSDHSVLNINLNNIFGESTYYEPDNMQQSQVEYDDFKDATFPQVFNIPDNKYSYKEAQEICKAYDGKLASYEDVERYYKSGGEFCNYGWSDKQMILYPTQKGTFERLQKIKGHEWDCGRIGINGGYIANPEAKFGVNCVAVKPPITSTEENLMINSDYYPKNEADIEMEKDVAKWKSQLHGLILSPFNQNKWSI